jgi:hypothetical protein
MYLPQRFALSSMLSSPSLHASLIPIACLYSRYHCVIGISLVLSHSWSSAIETDSQSLAFSLPEIAACRRSMKGLSRHCSSCCSGAKTCSATDTLSLLALTQDTSRRILDSLLLAGEVKFEMPNIKYQTCVHRTPSTTFSSRFCEVARQPLYKAKLFCAAMTSYRCLRTSRMLQLL